MTTVKADPISDCRVYDTCTTALQWADEREFAGWDPYDGLNSPYFSKLPNNWLVRLLGTHLVHRSPINLRPLLNIPKERNPKGIALFAMSYLNLYDATGDDRYRRKAETLLDWLDENRSPGYDLPCWGYNFDWQNARKFFLPAYEPSIVVSTFCARAYLSHYEATGETRSLRIATATAEFIRSHINTVRIDGYTAYSYTTSDSFVVINANALAAALFATVGRARDDPELFDRATRLMEFVLFAQTDYGAWYYSMPRTDSHLTHDNFHTGFVLEALGTYIDLADQSAEFETAYDTGMEFYRENLIEADGAPKFEADRRYPRDAHAAGQAIRTLALDGRPTYRRVAESVVDWSLEHLFDDAGFFYCRRGRVFDKKTPFMRWSQAWMCFGLSACL